jgi:hypothetical protein
MVLNFPGASGATRWGLGLQALESGLGVWAGLGVQLDLQVLSLCPPGPAPRVAGPADDIGVVNLEWEQS